MVKDTVLTLDKESHIQWTLKTILEGEKYIVLPVDTLEKALQNFEEFEVAGLVTEYRIDQSQTPEVIREPKKKNPKRSLRKRSNMVTIIYFGIGKILIDLKKELGRRKILIQKKSLEQRLSEIRTSRNVQEAAMCREPTPS